MMLPPMAYKAPWVSIKCVTFVAKDPAMSAAAMIGRPAPTIKIKSSALSFCNMNFLIPELWTRPADPWRIASQSRDHEKRLSLLTLRSMSKSIPLLISRKQQDTNHVHNPLRIVRKEDKKNLLRKSQHTVAVVPIAAIPAGFSENGS